MSEKALILMATYNGSKYLRLQLDSICKQTYDNWKLIIRDDGSIDDTIDIIKEYCQLDYRVSLISNDSGVHGAYQNFWALIHYARNNEEFKYCFFSDQDDIWPENKMEIMISEANNYDDNKPLLIYGDMEIIDENGDTVEKSLNSIMGIGKMSGYTEFYSAAFVWGCNMMINHRLFEIVEPFPINHPAIHRMSHDNYYTKVCQITGNIRYLDTTLLLHRRHSNNVTSGNELKLSLKGILRKAILEFNELGKTHANGYVQTYFTLEMMEKSGIYSEVTDKVKTAICNGGINGVGVLFSQKVRRKQISRTFGIYVVMLLKSYKKYFNKIINEENI